MSFAQLRLVAFTPGQARDIFKIVTRSETHPARRPNASLAQSIHVIAAPPTSSTSDPTLSLGGVPGIPSDPSGASAGRPRSNLLQRVGTGDLAAVQTCMNRFGSMVWSMARRFSPSREDAEDAVQEIFTELWKSASRYDPSQSSEEAFVAMIAWRRLVDRLRAAKRQPPTESLGSDVQSSAAADSGPTSSADSAALERALRQLRSEQRDVLVFATCQGLTHQQIAARMGLAVGTVKTHARRGLLRLRALLFDAAADVSDAGGSTQ